MTPEEPEPSPDESLPASYPATDDDDLPSLFPTGDGGTTRFLERLTRATPFLDLHERAGAVQDHVWRGRICFTLDLLVRLVVWVVMVSVVLAIAWKALAPLPDLT